MGLGGKKEKTDDYQAAADQEPEWEDWDEIEGGNAPAREEFADEVHAEGAHETPPSPTNRPHAPAMYEVPAAPGPARVPAEAQAPAAPVPVVELPAPGAPVGKPAAGAMNLGVKMNAPKSSGRPAAAKAPSTNDMFAEMGIGMTTSSVKKQEKHKVSETAARNLAMTRQAFQNTGPAAPEQASSRLALAMDEDDDDDDGGGGDNWGDDDDDLGFVEEKKERRRAKPREKKEKVKKAVAVKMDDVDFDDDDE